jgi:dTDP-4-amino-4,6-dideoxy-D-galactose acyltransferase
MKKLTWESNFFNQCCGEINNFTESFDINKASSFDWLQAKASISEEEKIHYLESNGFLFEDLKLTFEKKLANNIKTPRESVSIREAVNSDIDHVQLIAQSVLPEKSRFLSLTGKKKTADFYSEWARKSITQDFDNVCYVALVNNQIIGFVTLKYIDNFSAQIGLLAVTQQYQKRSTGTYLLSYCEQALIKKGFEKLFVSTAGKNIAAQNFYINNHFNISSIECWFYRKS